MGAQVAQGHLSAVVQCDGLEPRQDHVLGCSVVGVQRVVYVVWGWCGMVRGGDKITQAAVLTLSRHTLSPRSRPPLATTHSHTLNSLTHFHAQPAQPGDEHVGGGHAPHALLAVHRQLQPARAGGVGRTRGACKRGGRRRTTCASPRLVDMQQQQQLHGGRAQRYPGARLNRRQRTWRECRSSSISTAAGAPLAAGRPARTRCRSEQESQRKFGWQHVTLNVSVGQYINSDWWTAVSGDRVATQANNRNSNPGRVPVAHPPTDLRRRCSSWSSWRRGRPAPAAAWERKGASKSGQLTMPSSQQSERPIQAASGWRVAPPPIARQHCVQCSHGLPAGMLKEIAQGTLRSRRLVLGREQAGSIAIMRAAASSAPQAGSQASGWIQHTRKHLRLVRGASLGHEALRFPVRPWLRPAASQINAPD